MEILISYDMAMKDEYLLVFQEMNEPLLNIPGSSQSPFIQKQLTEISLTFIG